MPPMVLMERGEAGMMIEEKRMRDLLISVTSPSPEIESELLI